MAPALLAQGLKSGEVLLMQRKLVLLGYLDEAAWNTHPGYFGPNTKEAVKRFQSRESLAVDGIVGPNTLARLDERTANLHTQLPATGDERKRVEKWKLFGAALNELMKKLDAMDKVRCDYEKGVCPGK